MLMNPPSDEAVDVVVDAAVADADADADADLDVVVRGVEFAEIDG